MKAVGYRPETGQLRAAIERLNSVMVTSDRLILQVDVLGPDGLGEIGRALQVRARDLLGVVNDMNKRFKDESVRKVQYETVPALLAAIETATAQVRTLLNA